MKIEIDEATRATLEGWLRRQTIAAGLATRARAMVLLADGQPYTYTAAQVGLAERHVRTWATRFVAAGIDGLHDRPRPGRRLTFPPAVAMHVVQIAGERPDDRGRSLCHWECAERARTLVAQGLVVGISGETVRRILSHHKLKPWRPHRWLSAKTPRDAAVAHQVQESADLYTRPQTVAGFADLLSSTEPARVITPTHPGFGGSPRPTALDSIAGLAATYIALLAELDLSDVTIIGNSIGGWITAEMALLGSSRIGSIVLVDAVGIDVDDHPVVDFFSLTMDQVARLS